MTDSIWLIGFAVMVLAGTVKGLVGMGMPTIGIGLLSLIVPPAQAAAILLVPTAVTNIWQCAAGPSLMATTRRFGLMMVMVVLGTFVGGYALGGLTSPLAVPTIGFILLVYGVLGLSAVSITVPAGWEGRLSPLVGIASGIVNGLTGVSVLPVAPYLKALGLEREEMIQALGLSFTVSAAALAVNLALPTDGPSVLSDPRMTLASVAALGPALIGMEAGRRLRLLASPALYSRLFFGGLALLGAYMMARGLIHAMR